MAREWNYATLACSVGLLVSYASPSVRAGAVTELPVSAVVAHKPIGAGLANPSPIDRKVGPTRSSVNQGRRLFTKETFGGNGRTCESCHDLSTGTTSPADAQALFDASESHRGDSHSQHPLDPLFRSIDSDDGVGDSYTRLLEHATIRVVIDLPPWLSLDEQPSARNVVLNRGIPSTINSSLLVPVLMQDGRETELETQALDAVIAHAEPTLLPSSSQREDIAQFERTLFSSDKLADYFQGGPPPELPQGTTPSEIRGRTFLEPGGLCNRCHSGPMLNETTAADFMGPGRRFEDIFVSEVNSIGNPVHSWEFQNPDGTVSHFDSPDPGLALIQPEIPVGSFELAPVNFFRIPTLWNVKATAPYFHDNSANTLEDVLMHYRLYLFPLTEQDAADIIAYLRLL